ncbi:protein-methionine-sulfoxide reductase heme-binding subunit MsrQ [Phaeobacter gallaeciensis]|uniref:protein-methionine-sulfoxide reductase heme-binding subunit MsrQ n=1 Tax=Phaeobacter gallaeciensis TaxID=60890 RepID=UPI00237F2BD8|nr:protein-methionine-sulfoxide reductase heme-binding subunit MsrQ [Phaeobacter gallaeciensis]MDE4191884.1 protein-methionine-sulfoxide reductase heme-binding subunit MsrQ [Phaeobacter gallaeciensis]MDE4200347.1 protein-methionine-sulfoxide reductase heme-binding subunit MsrQ [Phaeobacter gallaeciensis]MDE4204499.1 protein-methionine-sulfoxide reductase heme-binding subunit MsrQ [Phaeobacter gallaeciensis]MDE4208639.1 protein-methionine-sulfoxide reductase heme-binding subunit MsrQ [Phaeobacte
MDGLNQLLRRVPVWSVYLLGLLPVPGLFFLALTGGLGVEPVKALEHEYGELALKLLVAVLAVTPLRRYAGLNLMRFRRALGVLSFIYVLCHLLVWLLLDVQIPSQILADILKRPYITIGMAAFVLLLPLAVTSNNASVRRLGPRWRILHRLTYPAVALGAVHYVMLVKGFQIEPLVYLAVILALLALRLPVVRRKATT